MIWWQYVIPQHLLSKLMFHFARIKNIWLKNRFIAWFVRSYQVNLSEAVCENIEDYQHFNDFFTRALKPNARKIADSLIVCPVDGKVSKVGNIINNTQIIQAKNHRYSVGQLLGNDARSVEFKAGFFATIYLSPKDYHRIHMPYDGTLISMSYIPGDLFSVNQTTAENVDGLFARNERVVCYFETEFGLCAFVLVGAIFVGSMQTVWHGQINPPYQKKIQHFDYSNESISLKKGQELGRFNMGSTVIMLMPDQANKFSLKEAEVVRMGQALV
ncbi:phosphatidylserine decarboxylase [Abyssogena phaseoliformis symbiont OG214]|uniref:archaetidylserine decarboxylase n=1 Tax=Abyssogena phaseoliformis symbiont TaxID=596095 RepID=UPI0019157AF1|nr:Phosphatidylserine decarboxylase [Candidatus Ruthia sp. Apha_13_S6]BBB22433.1 phosphatidylserine decarboxylase [Abyssogena phaseoliformis symbiont OG214]